MKQGTSAPLRWWSVGWGRGLHWLRRWAAGLTPGRRFLPWTLLLMLAFYAAIYRNYAEGSVAARFLLGYLQLAAVGSATVLGWFGEAVSVEGTTVLGRFPYQVVLDCAALDAQALFAAAVIAFPVSLRDKLLGLIAGLSGIWCINVGRLVVLYFAGAESLELFQVLHEEVFVLLVILSVCGAFAAWAYWALERARRPTAEGAARAA